MMTRRVWLAFAISVSLTTQTLAAEAALTWSVVDRFPLLATLGSDTLDTWLPGSQESFSAWYFRMWIAHRRGDVLRSPLAVDDQNQKGAWNSQIGSYRREYLQKYVHSSDVVVRLATAGLLGSCRWEIQDLQPRDGPCAGIDVALPLKETLVRVMQGVVERAEVKVRPTRLIVLAFGDSYASGEGNPDVAAVWSGKRVNAGDYEWLKSRPGTTGYLRVGAMWWDTRCHRSFWNHQIFAALKLAAGDPHTQVTLLDYACSGAGIIDGILAPQVDPPGKPDGTVQFSQLHEAVADLCDVASGGALRRSKYAERVATLLRSKSFEKIRHLEKQDALHGEELDLPECVGRAAVPDLAMISIGGNDVGFAGLVAWAILPERSRYRLLNYVFPKFVRWGHIVCPQKGVNNARECKRPYFEQLVDQLPNRFRLLGVSLPGLLNIPPDRVVVTGYPDPIRKEQRVSLETMCYDEKPSTESPWDAAASQVPRAFRYKHWEFDITGGKPGTEAELLVDDALPYLRRVMRGAVESAAAPPGGQVGGFRYVAESEDAFVGHTWCNRTSDERLPLSLPSAPRVDWPGKCSRNPGCWSPYEPKERYIRTFNDAMLTQTSSRRDGFNGMMHPTAQGQAAIADTLWPTVSAILIGTRK
jgi:hypothetical protein